MHCFTRSGGRQRLSLMIVLLAGIGIFGCTVRQQPEPPRVEPPEQEIELLTWQEGLQAFREGDFDKALVLFEIISESAQPEALSRKALFALAATRLVMAQTPEEFGQALATWECWDQQLPHPIEDEDPRLLTPFLLRLTPPGVPENQVREHQPPVKKISIGSTAVCRDLLQAKDREIERIKARLDAKEKEARRLKHQIESLEAIHLKYQERKQGVSSP